MNINKHRGFQVTKIKKEALGKRITVYILDDESLLDPIDFRDIQNEIEETVSTLQRVNLHGSVVLGTPKLVLIPDNEPIDINNLIENKPFQIFISADNNHTISIRNIQKMKSLAYIKYDEKQETPLFEACKHESINAVKINIGRKDAFKYIKSFFLDIIFGNSDCISKVIEKYLTQNTMEDLFKLKREFLKRTIPTSLQLETTSDHYVNFAFEAYANGRFDNNLFITLWDKFILEELKDYLCDLDSLFDYIIELPNHKDQTSQKSLINAIKKVKVDHPAAYIILLPYRTPKAEDLNLAKSIYNGIKGDNLKHWHRYILAEKWDNFVKIKQHPFIDKLYLEPIKVYIKD